MLNLLSHLRYAARQFRGSPVFTAAAVLTLALGISGTTAILTLMDAVMLRSLPVSDPGRLYRIGEGDDCCVDGGPQDRWGMYSFPLYERLKTAAPEFEEITAFQAGGARVSVRRESALARDLSFLLMLLCQSCGTISQVTEDLLRQNVASSKTRCITAVSAKACFRGSAMP
jgi:hypothetical protein